MPDKLIINFTPTGMIPTREMTPHVPVTPAEIIRDVLEARHYGVSIAHIHARDETGLPTYRGEVYEEIISGIRAVDRALVITVSTSGRNWSDLEKRAECLMIDGGNKPDMASLTLSSLNFNNQASINTPQMIQALAGRMLERGIKPELEAFDLGMINYAKYLIRKNLLAAPHYFNLILGNIACAQATALNLGLMLNELPPVSVWAAGGVGDAQLRMNLIAMMSGGGVRVGLEDTIWLTPKRDRLATNLDLVRRIHSLACAAGIEVATPEEVRGWLRLPQTSGA